MPVNCLVQSILLCTVRMKMSFQCRNIIMQLQATFIIIIVTQTWLTQFSEFSFHFLYGVIRDGDTVNIILHSASTFLLPKNKECTTMTYVTISAENKPKLWLIQDNLCQPPLKHINSS